MIVSSFPRSLVIQPIAIINIAIDVYKLSFSISFVVVPITFISGSIWPNLYPISFSKLTSPTSVVNNIITESDRWFFSYFFILVLRSRRRQCIKVWFILLSHTRSTKLTKNYYATLPTLTGLGTSSA